MPFTADFPNGPPQAVDPLAGGQTESLKPLLQALGANLTVRGWARADGGRVYGVWVRPADEPIIFAKQPGHIATHRLPIS